MGLQDWMAGSPQHFMPFQALSPLRESVSPQGSPVRGRAEAAQLRPRFPFCRLTQWGEGTRTKSRGLQGSRKAGPFLGASASQLPLLLEETRALRKPPRPISTLRGRAGVSRGRLGAWLSRSVAASLSFQMMRPDQMVTTKIPSTLMLCDLENQDPRRVCKCPSAPKPFLANS